MIVAQALAHWRFYRRAGVLRLREVATVLLLAPLTVIAEAGGMAMLLPILQFVEQGRNVEVFARSSGFASAIVDVYAAIGVPVSLLSLSANVFVLVLIRQGINYFNSIEIERIKWNIGRRISGRVFEAILGSQAANVRRYKPGEFTVTIEYECHAAAGLLRVYGNMWMQFVSFVAYGAVLIWTAPLASLLAAVMMVVATLGIRVLLRTTKRLSTVGMDIRRGYADFLNERFRAWKLIKLGNGLPAEVRKVDELQSRFVANELHLLRIAGVILLIFAPMMCAFLLAMLYIFVEVLALNIATIALFVLVMIRLMPVTQALQQQLGLLTTFVPSMERIDATLKLAAANAEKIDAGIGISQVAKSIQLDHVFFTYPDREDAALADVSLTIPAGRMTALIGPSGAGKSTLVDLIPRIVEPSRGRVLFDGRPAQDISLRSLRRLIAYVPQEPFLFDTTFAENIRYLRADATDGEVAEAARFANAADFIERLPKGYETRVGDAGAALSGGQKQRVVLARAFLSKAQILILDEPTSALDYESEAAIQRAIEEMRRSRALTVIVIAHRLSTVRNADLVVHIQEGRVLRFGPAAEILGQINAADADLGIHSSLAAAQ